MSKRLQDLKWQNVSVEGFPAALTEKFQGFAGLEECTSYCLDKESKKSKKKKQTTKPQKRKAVSNTETLSKKVKLSNGFFEETCTNSKPSLTNSEDQKNTHKATKAPPEQNKNKQNKTNSNRIGSKDESVPSVSIDDMQAWSSLNVPEEILKALAEQGFNKPTRIQEMTLPTAMLGRRDILGAAQTGSGKTLAFGIPILAGIMRLKEKAASGEDVYEIKYKKSSVKKTEEKVHTKKDTKVKTKKNKKVKKAESSEDGYSSADDDDDDKEAKEEDYIEEYDVPIKKRESADEGNASDDSDEYVHLSDMLDDADLEDSSNDDDNDAQEETDSQDEIDNDAGSDEEIDNDVQSDGEVIDNDAGSDDDHGDPSDDDNDGQDNGGIGCVKVIDNIEIPGHVITKTGKPLYALILTPTRELAMQVSRHLMGAAKYTGIRIATVVGGMAAVKQERVLSKGPEVVVATPGRLWELMRQGEPHLQQVDNIKFLAIDETDRMVERNHFEELHPLLERLNYDEEKKGSRQNFVFSATLTMVHDLPTHMKGKKVTKHGKILNRKIQKMTPAQKIKKLVNMIGMTDPKVVDITQNNFGAADTLTQCRIVCSLEQKDYYLYYILKTHPGRTIVFCNSIGSVKRLTQLFGFLKCFPLPLHASMPQRQRLKNLEKFVSSPTAVLVSTDVSSRGLDVPGVDHVIHYQVPRTAENYIHRSGRTARANKEGLTILMMEPGEAHLYTKLCRTLDMQSELPTFPVPSHVLNSMKDIVTLAREVDRLQLTHKRAAQEQGWLDKAAKDMDMLIDEDFVQTSQQDKTANKTLAMKKKKLEALISKPILPQNFSFKYPTLNNEVPGEQKTERAITVMKRAIETGELKKQKRKGKNDALLRITKELKN